MRDEGKMMEKKPLVSVIIPCYNGEKFIGDAIESVVNQTYKNWELIIVDDGSTDNSERIIKKYLQDDRIQYIKHKKNRGIPAARNTGINASKGEFIALLDDDDKWVPYKLSLQLEEFYKNAADLGLVFGNIIMINSNGYVIRKGKNLKINLEKLTQEEILERLFLSNFISSITVLFKRECIREVEGFDENIKWGGDDYDLWLRIVGKFKIKYLNRVLAMRREHCNNYTKIEKMAKGDIKLVKKVIRKYPFLENLRHKKIARDLYQLGRCKHLTGNFKEARELYSEAFSHCLAITCKPYIAYLFALLKIKFDRREIMKEDE